MLNSLRIGILLLLMSFTHAAWATVFYAVDYETGNFNQGPTAFAPNAGFCCAHSGTIVTPPVAGLPTARQGTRAAKIELRFGDPPRLNSTRAERVYRGDNRVGVIGGAEEWYGFSIFLPAGYVSDTGGTPLHEWDTRAFDILFQIHHTPDPGEISGNPPLALATDGPIWRLVSVHSSIAIVTDVDQGIRRTIFTSPWAGDTGTWTDWLIRVRWSCKGAVPAVPKCENMPNPILQVWKNGVQVANDTGPNTYNDVGRNSPQWGIYKPRWNNATTAIATRIIYNDELRVGSTRAEVEVGAGPPAPDTTAPSAPTNLQLTVQSEASIAATWTGSIDTGGSGLAGYNRYICAGAGCTPALAGTSNPTDHVFTGLEPETLYRIQIAAVDGAGNVSTKTAISEALTPINVLRVTNHIANSGNFSVNHPWQKLYNGIINEEGAGNVGQTSFFVEHDLGELITLDAIDVTGDADGSWLCKTFTFQYKVLAGDPYTTVLNNVNCQSNATITHDLGDVVGRYVKATFSCAGCNGVQAEELFLRGVPAPDIPVPDVPTGLVAHVQSATAIIYAWDATTGAETYRFYLCAGIGCTPQLIDNDATSPLLLDFLAPQTLYRAQVSAVNIELEESAKTVIVGAETLAEDPDEEPPPPTTGLQIVQTGTRELDLQCDASIANVAGYRFRRCDTPGCTPATPDVILEALMCHLTDAGLQPNRTYSYQVTAFDGFGNESDPSEIVPVVTLREGGVTYGVGFQ